MSNKKKLKAVSIMLLLIMIASVLGGCTTFDNFKKTFVDKQVVGDDNTITIGIYEPSSGEMESRLNSLESITSLMSIQRKVRYRTSSR